MISCKMLIKLQLLVPVTAFLLSGCAGGGLMLQEQARIGVINFQQCRPDYTFKEIGLDDIQNRNEALECSRKGMPLIFSAELKQRLQERLKREVQLVPLDVPNNYNIISQIDIARRYNIDFLVGGMLERYIDSSATKRAKKQGILPATATLSPVMEKAAASTVLVANVKVARVSDSSLLAEFECKEEGDKSGDVYTFKLADKIAEKVFEVH